MKVKYVPIVFVAMSSFLALDAAAWNCTQKCPSSVFSGKLECQAYQAVCTRPSQTKPTAPPPQTTSQSKTKGSSVSVVGGLAWSQSGAISGMKCVNVHEDSDPHAWNDNYLCGVRDYGLRWSQSGEIQGMKCTKIHEDSDPHTWNDNYLCVPDTKSAINFSWSQAGPIKGLTCLRIYEDADPNMWGDNHLCWNGRFMDGWYIPDDVTAQQPSTSINGVNNRPIIVKPPVVKNPTNFNIDDVNRGVKKAGEVIFGPPPKEKPRQPQGGIRG